MNNTNQITPDIFSGFIADFCVRSPLARNYLLRWTLILNPKAGGFSIKSRRKKHYVQLAEIFGRIVSVPPDTQSCPSNTGLMENKRGLILTSAKGHAEAVTRALIEEALSAPENPGNKTLYLIIAAGGDGTSLEILSTLYSAPEEVRSRFVVLRLPMGTGNDGADSFELDEALRLLIEPSVISHQKTLRLFTSTEGKGPFLAFNILSAGIDAFVTHMTNKMKGKLPGDFYKLWVDIAALLYDRLYKVGYLDIRALDETGNEVKKIREKILLVAVGESGFRYYGSHKNILPDERNVCVVKQMSLLRKVALKSLFTSGKHVEKPESILFNAETVEITGEFPILAQMDGETVLLEKNDFPVRIELSKPVIPVLKLSKS